MKLSLGDKWTTKLKRQVEGYELEVGVLEDKPHKNPVETKRFEDPLLGSYAGGPVRRKTGTVGELTTAEILVQNMQRMNINILLRPFQENNSDILKFTSYFLKYIIGGLGGNQKRVENLAQAIVRNPILKQEYGPNSSQAADAKGFDRHLFDTGQMFQAIKARVKKRVG